MTILEARIPWLVFAEDCIVGPTNRPRHIQLDAVPAVRQNRTPPRLKSRVQRRLASLNTPLKPDPQLSIITLTSVHNPQFPSHKHKSPIEILSDLHSKQAKYDLYRNLPVETRTILRKTTTSHSCILPSVDQVEDLTKTPKERREMEEEEREMRGESQKYAENLMKCEEEAEENEKKSQESPQRNSISVQRSIPKINPLFTPPINHFPKVSHQKDKCPGDFCSFPLKNEPIFDENRRFPIKRRLLQLAKLKEFSQFHRLELKIPSNEEFSGYSTGKALDFAGKKTGILKPKSALAGQRGLVRGIGAGEEVRVCFRCFVVYENLKRLLE